MSKKFYFIICNYNAQRQDGALQKSLAALQRIKNENVIVSMFDNMSKDGSVDIINGFYKNGTIDHVVLSGRNYGKAFAMNRLYEYLDHAYFIDNNDIIVSMDSDMILDYPRFFENTEQAISPLTVGYVGFDFWGNDGKTVKNGYQSNVAYSDLQYINGVRYGRISSGSGLAGGILCIKNILFSKIRYNEHLGKNMSAAVYGGDDAILTLQLFKSGYTGLFDIDSPIIHYQSSDPEYIKWKDQTNANMCRNGFGNSTLPVKGFYD